MAQPGERNAAELGPEQPALSASKAASCVALVEVAEVGKDLLGPTARCLEDLIGEHETVDAPFIADPRLSARRSPSFLLPAVTRFSAQAQAVDKSLLMAAVCVRSAKLLAPRPASAPTTNE